MMKRNSFLAIIVFSLLVGSLPTNMNAFEVSPKMKMIGGASAALVAGLGSWYCRKKFQECADQIDITEFAGNSDDEVLESLKRKKRLYTLVAWLTGGISVAGVGVAAWGGVQRFYGQSSCKKETREEAVELCSDDESDDF
ncbi:hypothetical protein KKA53_02955 [Candidatus Dependentiae bacterium]|nr:hypothetical protein [Candidatus Dependentiae bacterium]